MRPRHHTPQHHRRRHPGYILERRRLLLLGCGIVIHVQLNDTAAITPLFWEMVSDVRFAAEEGGQLDAFVADEEFDDLEAGVVGCWDQGVVEGFEAGDGGVGASEER